MKKLLFSLLQFFLFIASLLFIIQAKAQCNWQTVGLAGFSTNSVSAAAIAIDNNGTPYVAYPDGGNSYKTTVMKFNGSNWVTVGLAGFSASVAAWIDIAIDNSGTPYVVYADGGNGLKASVMKFNGSNWVTVGLAGFSAGYSPWAKIAIDNNGTPYVAYADGNLGGTTVMKFDGTGWVTVGSAGFGTAQVSNGYNSLAIDGSGVPYVVYRENSSFKATVMKFNGSSWVTVGSAGFSAGAAWWTSIAIDGNGAPYVAYQDGGNGNKATAMKFNGSSWVNIGSAGFSAGGVSFTSIAIDNSGTPYVAYTDGANSSKATVMKFNGSAWQNVGFAGFSAGVIYATDIAVNSSGVPYVVYADGGNSNKATVMKYIPGSVITNTANVTACGSYVWQGTTYTASTNAPTRTITSSGGCDSIVTLNLTINSLPNLSVSVSSTICVNETGTLAANGANTYTWSTNENSASINVTPSVTTSYSVSGTNNNGCIGSSSVTLYVDECLGINELEKGNDDFKIYPNPNSDLLTVEVKENANIVVINSLGQVVYRRITNSNKTEISMQKFPNGIYFVRIGDTTKKVIKE